MTKQIEILAYFDPDALFKSNASSLHLPNKCFIEHHHNRHNRHNHVIHILIYLFLILIKIPGPPHHHHTHTHTRYRSCIIMHHHEFSIIAHKSKKYYNNNKHIYTYRLLGTSIYTEFDAGDDFDC